MRLPVPDDEQHHAFQQVAVGVSGLAQAEEQPLEFIAQEQQVEVASAMRAL
jgi:hypothetical protein